MYLIDVLCAWQLHTHEHTSSFRSPGVNFWQVIIFDIQGCILRTLILGPIFLIDLLFVIKDFDITSYAGDNTPYMSANNMDRVVHSLEQVFTKSLKWFSDNLIKSNDDKCHLIVSTNNTVSIKVENFEKKVVTMRNSQELNSITN